MAALRAETNTEISVAGTRNPPWEVDFSHFTQIEPKRCSFDASRRAISGGMSQSARFLGLVRDFGRALIRKITWPAP